MNPNQLNDLKRMLLGEHLGAGQYRQVYANRLDPNTVVKIEEDDGCFHNVLEWNIWREVEHMPALAPWFAPCHHISPCGLILIQSRTTPIQARDLPKQIPNIFTDLKPGNWGWLDGKPVAHDYALHILNLTSRKRKVTWKND